MELKGVTPGASVESAVAEGARVTLGGYYADVGEVSGLLARGAETHGPQDEHLAAHDRVRVPVAVGKHGSLLVG